MTDQESAQILNLIAIAWPRQKLPRATTALYGAMLTDLSYNETVTAVETLISRCEWAPSIAEIRQEVAERRACLPDPQEAWMLVCLRWGPSKGRGDKSVELRPLIIAALDAAGVNPHSFYTSEKRHWLKQAFLDIYTVMRRDALKWENERSRFLDQPEALNGNARVGANLGVHAVAAEGLPDAADARRPQLNE